MSAPMPNFDYFVALYSTLTLGVVVGATNIDDYQYRVDVQGDTTILIIWAFDGDRLEAKSFPEVPGFPNEWTSTFDEDQGAYVDASGAHI